MNADTTRRRLGALRDEIAARAASVDEALAALTRDRASANDDDEHDPEGVPLSAEWSRLQALRDAAADESRQVDAAFERLDAGTYGVCAGCGQPIPAGRLEVRPFAEYCVACAERR